jgi:hypothetical protein
VEKLENSGVGEASIQKATTTTETSGPSEDSILAVMASGYSREEATEALLMASSSIPPKDDDDSSNSSDEGAASKKKRKKEKKKKHNKNKHKDAKQKHFLFQSPSLVGQTSAREPVEEKRDTTQDNARMLKALFDGSDIRSVFSHDVVEQETEGGLTQDRRFIDAEARKIATKAVVMLKKSQERIQGENRNFMPTWTGNRGITGAPGRFGGSRSATVLASIRRNNDAEEKTNEGEVSGKFDKIMKKLHTMLNKSENKRNGVSTDEILKHFMQDVTERDSTIFRQMLRQVAVCRRGQWFWAENAAPSSSADSGDQSQQRNSSTAGRQLQQSTSNSTGGIDGPNGLLQQSRSTVRSRTN